MAKDFTQQLADYQELIQKDITKTAARLEADALQHFGDHGRDAVKAYTAILARGGKRLRGALVLVGYQMCGGKNVQDVLPIARAMEMLHAYLLVTDDVFDQSATRRGGPTAHVMLRGLHDSYKWRGDAQHFGESAASCAAIVGCHQAIQEIINAPINADKKVAALRVINHAVAVTGFGQVHDMFNEATGRVSMGDVENTHIWKTAYYTFIAPLQAGAIAAGQAESDLECLYNYGKYMGLAFQAADDVLGVFGDKSGKSTYDDLRDGKMTLLAAFMWQRATLEQKDVFNTCFGRTDFTEKEFIACKKALVQSGARDFVQNIAQQQAKKAVDALDIAPQSWHAEHLQFLRDLANYVVNRTA